jgi:hypothetical protein
MRKLLFALFGLAVLFSACQKDDVGKLDPPSDKIDPSNAQKVSDNIKIFHASRVSGNPPAPTTTANSPKLDPSSNNQSIKALAGRYAIIQPEVLSGEVAGYYVKVAGANNYFKVDYTKPRGLKNRGDGAGLLSAAQNGSVTEGSTNNPRSNLFFKKRSNTGGTITGINGSNGINDFSDSAIVIVLPPSIKPGTFCVEYCIYDAQNNISNIIKLCITVEALGAGSDGGGFVGIWKITGQKENNEPWDRTIYDKYIEPPFNVNCYNGKLSYDCLSGNCTPVSITGQYEQTLLADLTLAINGGMKYESKDEENNIDFAASTCSNVVYKKEMYSETILGGWSYNDITKKLILLFDDPDYIDPGNTDPFVVEYDVTEKTATKFVIKDPFDNFYIEFTKK